MEYLNDIAARLREVRGELTQAQFAERLREQAGYSVTQSSVGEYERGETNIPAVYLAAVSKAFDVNPAWLLAGEPPKAWSQEARRNRDAQVTAQHLRRLADLVDEGAEGEKELGEELLSYLRSAN